MPGPLELAGPWLWGTNTNRSTQTWWGKTPGPRHCSKAIWSPPNFQGQLPLTGHFTAPGQFHHPYLDWPQYLLGAAGPLTKITYVLSGSQPDTAQVLKTKPDSHPGFLGGLLMGPASMEKSLRTKAHGSPVAPPEEPRGPGRVLRPHGTPRTAVREESAWDHPGGMGSQAT